MEPQSACKLCWYVLSIEFKVVPGRKEIAIFGGYGSTSNSKQVGRLNDLLLVSYDGTISVQYSPY